MKKRYHLILSTFSELLASGGDGSLIFLCIHIVKLRSLMCHYIADCCCILIVNSLLRLNKLLLSLYHVVLIMQHLGYAILQVVHQWWLIHWSWSFVGGTYCCSAWITAGFVDWVYYCWGFCFYWRFRWFFQPRLDLEEYGLFSDSRIALTTLVVHQLFFWSRKSWIILGNKFL